MKVSRISIYQAAHCLGTIRLRRSSHLRSPPLEKPQHTTHATAFPTNTDQTSQFLTTAPLLHYLRPRIPVPPSSLPRRLNLSFLTLKPFWILSSANLLQSLGYFLPTAYLPSYALSLSLSPHTSTLLLALLNGVSVPGSAILGAAIDRCGLGPVVLVSSAGSTVAVFALWGLAGASLPGLVAFAVAYGFFAGGFSSTWSGMLKELERLSPGLETGLVFGLLAGGRGVSGSFAFR